MTIKPFAIQGSDLTLGGVNLQAGATTIVIPGVTQATNYRVEEVNETDVEQTFSNFPAESEVVVIDKALYDTIVGNGNVSTFADFTATTNDDGEIDEIEVNGQGTYSLANADRARLNDMYAYIGAGSASDRPLVPEDWITIPFRPRMRANAVESIGGGGGSGGVVERSIEFPQGEEGDTAGTLALTPSGNLYICKTDWSDYSDAGGSYGGFETSEEYLPTQSGFVSNYVTILLADVPSELLYILQNVNINASDWSVIMDDEEFGGEQTCTNVGFNVDGNPSFSWPYRNGTDPNGIPAGSGFTVAYSGEVPQPAIWEQIDIGSLGDLTVFNGNEIVNGDGDITLNADSDVLLEAGDDIRITADDDIRIRTYSSNVHIITNYDSNNNSDHVWDFDESGVLHLPEGGDIVDSNGNSVLGGANSDPRVWVQTFVTDTPATDFPQMATSVEYDADGNVIALFSHNQSTGLGPDTRYFSVGKYAATGTKLWTVRFAADLNTDGWGLAVDSVDNWIYIAGSTYGSDYTYPVSTLTKIDGSTGSIEWSKVYDFGFESSSAVVDVDSAGHPIMVGYADDDNNDGYLTITKVDATNGNVTWTRKLDGQTNEQAYGMAVGPNDEVVAVGYMDQFGPTDVAATLYADPVSNVLWTGTNVGFAVTDGVYFEVSFTDGVPTFSNIQDAVGGRTVDGVFHTISGNAIGGVTGVDDLIVKVATIGTDGDDRMVVVKYLDDGSIAWQKAIQFDADYNCNGADADIDSAGNVYICGQYNIDGGLGTTGMALVKFNNMGVKQWSRRVVGDCISTATSIVVGPDDKLYISGVNGDEIAETFTWVVAKYDFDGLVEWQRFMENNTASTFGGQFFNGEGGGSNIAVRQGYVALGGGFADLSLMDLQPYATVIQVPTTGNVFTVGNWDFKAANLSGVLNSSASDITVVNAGLTDSNNASAIDTVTVTLDTEVGDFLVGTLFTAPGSGANELVNGEHVFALESDGTLTLDGDPFNGNGFAILADGTLQANVEGNTTTLTSTLQGGRPTWLTITPRSPDRNTLDTHYGFNSTGMWFAGDNEETFDKSPAYPIHTTDSFPADVKTVVEFDFNYVDGQEDWGLCVYPADGIPHWDWDPHPSRIAAMIDLGNPDIQINGLTDSTSRNFYAPTGIYRARFTYDPVAELTTFEAIVDGQVAARCQLPGRLARNQDYRIGFDADWDDAEGPTEKSYFSNLTITSGNTTDAKATELTVTGEIKLPNTTKGFVNIQGPWDNGDDDLHFQTVVAHDGFAYMGGETSWNENDTVRLDKYSLATGELVWTRVLGAGRDAEFNITWTGNVYSIDSIMNSGEGYKTGDLLYIAGFQLAGDGLLNRATITVTDVDNSGSIQTATIAGTAPDGDGSMSNVMEYNNDGHSDPISIKYDTVNDNLVMVNQQYTITGDADDLYWDRAVIVRVNPVSGDVVSTVTLSDEGDIRPYDVAIHPTTGATAVVGEKYNEFRTFGTLTMAVKGNGYFDILKSNLDPEHYPGSSVPGEYYNDFWISGTGITGKENIDNVNYYEGLSGTTRQGSGTVTVDLTAPTPITFSLQDFTDTLLLDGLNITKNADNFVTPGSFGGVWLTIVTGALATSITSVYTNGSIIPVTWGAGSTTTSGYALVYFNNDGTIQFTAVDSGGNAVAGNWYFPASLAVNSISVTVTAGGTNYLSGHKIKYLGTELPGGATPANDIILTVTGVDGSGAITTATAEGTMPGGDVTDLSAGTNYNVGSGLTLNIQVDAGGSRIASNNQQGSNYVAGDVVIISGTEFAGGATPANDVEVTVMAVEGTGQVSGNPGVVTAGTTPTNIIRVQVIGVDFTVVDGAWTMKQDLAGEAFVWTPTWNKAIGGASNDRFESVVYSKDGASIYAVGRGRYEVDYDQSLVVKYATSDGTIGFSKYLNSGTTNSSAYGVATIGTSDIVVSGYEYVGTTSRDTQFVARMTSSGIVVWKKLLINTWPSGIDQRNDIQVDSDDNIYVTISYQADTPNFTNDGFHVTKLDQAGNVVWSRCVNAPNDGSYLGYGNGNRWSSLHNEQLVVAGYTYATGDDYPSGLWASFPTDGFTYLGGEGDFVQMGAFRFSQGSIYVTEDLIPGASSFTPSVQAPTITATDNLKNYATRDPINFFEQHLHKMVDPKHGGVMFGDGSRQTFATDIMPQIKADRGYTITTQDSGKHIYYKNNSGTITIPLWARVKLPVGFTFTIVNRSGGDCYVQLEGWPGPRGTILGSDRNASYYEWGIPDTGSGCMVTLLLLEAGHDGGNGNVSEPVWMISGPDSIYPND
jgi:hypothetical protein